MAWRDVTSADSGNKWEGRVNREIPSGCGPWEAWRRTGWGEGGNRKECCSGAPIKRLGHRAPGIQTAKEQNDSTECESPPRLCLQEPPILGLLSPSAWSGHKGHILVGHHSPCHSPSLPLMSPSYSCDQYGSLEGRLYQGHSAGPSGWAPPLFLLTSGH